MFCLTLPLTQQFLHSKHHEDSLAADIQRLKAMIKYRNEYIEVHVHMYNYTVYMYVHYTCSLAVLYMCYLYHTCSFKDSFDIANMETD